MLPSLLWIRQQPMPALNGLSDTVKFICEDVFDLLPALEEKGEKYDVVILDPPAFTKVQKLCKECGEGIPRDQSSEP